MARDVGVGKDFIVLGLGGAFRFQYFISFNTYDRKWTYSGCFQDWKGD